MQFLSVSLDSPKASTIAEEIGEMYGKEISLHMLEYFCGIPHITQLLFASHPYRLCASRVRLERRNHSRHALHTSVVHAFQQTYG